MTKREPDIIPKEGSRASGPMHRREEENPDRNAVGVRRRVIEGEGLGGFARRYQVNAGGVTGFRGGLRFFCRCARIGFWLEIAQDSQCGGKPERAARRWPSEISRNIDPAAAGQHDVAGNNPQIAFLGPVTLDHICGTDREPPRQTTG